jgi:hypothetical protein
VVDLVEGADNTRTVNSRNEYGKELGLDFSNLTSVSRGLDTLEVDLWILGSLLRLTNNAYLLFEEEDLIKTSDRCGADSIDRFDTDRCIRHIWQTQ